MKFQKKVREWLIVCFGSQIGLDKQQRNFRFLEEALELVQSCGCTKQQALELVDYVYGRPSGEKSQEVGGVMITLASLCAAQKIDMISAGEEELGRVWKNILKIRKKNANKPDFSALPGVYEDAQ